MGISTGSFRSYDDCKNEWKKIIYPALTLTSAKDKKADIKLLRHISENEFENAWEINFAEIDNGKSAEQNEKRWVYLQKILGTRRVSKNISLLADQILSVVKSKKRNRPQPAQKKNDFSKFDIINFYNQNY